MTDALYLDDTAAKTFEATVERVAGDRIVLDQTCFYPTGGGQPHDTGRLVAADDGGEKGDDGGDEWTVTDVQKKDTIYHTVGDDTPTAGSTVTGHVDWERRFAHMRYHTAQHLLSAFLLDEYDAETTGNQLYDDHAHLDCAYDRFADDDLDDIETGLNDLVDDALPVQWYELTRDEAESTLDPERTRIHLLPDSITEIRIVEIGPESDPYDRTACAGTHVSDTADIGTVDVTGRKTQGSEHERIHFTLR
ncbi:alanyl-tRNA editing protein [Halogranum rubrum]|uniref:Alanyl-tRNA synthetase, class IIc-like protein n=1 Tax=Halogranum salarium B-1 TaxID=1210908 RepID=J3A4Q3_9EURY|nr:alanyl-tRNA editing protein [Halogranum salarium]EJN60453.1 Alanyl-tRNA synthetase, class IIc-like protein [Halogranum salarium B-1]